MFYCFLFPGAPGTARGDGARRWRAGRFVTQDPLSRHLRPRGPYRAFKCGSFWSRQRTSPCPNSTTLVKQFGVKQRADHARRSFKRVIQTLDVPTQQAHAKSMPMRRCRCSFWAALLGLAQLAAGSPLLRSNAGAIMTPAAAQSKEIGQPMSLWARASTTRSSGGAGG